ncbi:type IV pilus biogenesis protein PilP [Acerihabitans arboris]|uniref:Type IV pilus biogenesis protein PilP n=1 Tax=Acerihabitans arboris TaxID=2691583 RepID=A0A845SMV8_9GAMM|nr:type IV pilus biogenesis protein PilP [Acerihabitans arboris]NDL64286.1 type IV pilus biogenesis protein PilP [Acerihabitans arboris]
MHNVNAICLLWLLGVTAVFSQPVWAAEVPISAGTDNVTIGQLEAIQSRNFLLEQQVQTARLKRQLRESESIASETAASTTPLPFIPSRPAGEKSDAKFAATSSQKQASSPVRLQEIYGRGTQLRARILLSQGGVTEVIAGDQIPGSQLRVTAVTPATVRLSDGSELSF